MHLPHAAEAWAEEAPVIVPPAAIGPPLRFLEQTAPRGEGAALIVPAPAGPGQGVKWAAWGAVPLVAFNSAFDVFLQPWGHPGRWLRGRVGRNVLGAVGVLCLAAALALIVADGIGWAR
jgi:hypothetical protein